MNIFLRLNFAGASGVRENQASCSAADKDSWRYMSSMRSVGIILPIVLSTVAVAAVQQGNKAAAPAAAAVQVTSQASATEINYALADWRRLRSSAGYAFGDYARFLNANPGWPGET